MSSFASVCRGCKKDGAPCTKKTKSACGYCHLHENQAARTKPKVAVTPAKTPMADGKGNKTAKKEPLKTKDDADPVVLSPSDKESNSSERAAIKRQLGENLSGELQIAGVIGSSKYKPPDHGIGRCGSSWIKYWELQADKKRPARCCIKGCQNGIDAPGGGLHVWVKGKHRVKRCFIIPGCSSHNSSDYALDKVLSSDDDMDWIKTKKTAVLVPAPLSDTIRAKLEAS